MRNRSSAGNWKANFREALQCYGIPRNSGNFKRNNGNPTSQKREIDKMLRHAEQVPNWAAGFED
jgi:hypothetical protein